MGKKKPAHIESQIRESILISGKSFTEIARDYDVAYSVVYRISSCLKASDYDRMKIDYLEDSTTWEEQQFSSKYYGATNKQLLTSIRKDWKLF